MRRVPHQERVGTVLAGKYRLDHIIGSGGMGTVFAAVNQATGREVAVKLLHPDASEVDDLKARFLAEARAATAIQHPNVVDVLDLDAEGATPFIVMEMLRGAFEAAIGEALGSSAKAASRAPAIPETRGSIDARLAPTVPLPGSSPAAMPPARGSQSRGLPGWLVGVGAFVLVTVSVVGALGIGCVSCLQGLGEGVAAVRAVHPTCRVGFARSTCEFENTGTAPAARCTTVEVRQPATGAVLSGHVCSGEVQPDSTVTRAVEFRPGSLRAHCPVLADCVVRVVPDL